jgi:hypothetical protein
MKVIQIQDMIEGEIEVSPKGTGEGIENQNKANPS